MFHPFPDPEAQCRYVSVQIAETASRNARTAVPAASTSTGARATTGVSLLENVVHLRNVSGLLPPETLCTTFLGSVEARWFVGSRGCESH